MTVNTDTRATIVWGSTTTDDVKAAGDTLIDGSAAASKKGSKAASLAAVPVVTAAAGASLEAVGVPKPVTASLGALTGGQVVEACEPAMDASTKKTADAAKASLHAGVDSTSGSTASITGWIASWWS